MSEVSFAESLDRLKESFLFAAAQGGNIQDCQSLIEIGADVNWRNSDGDTPLLAACRRGHSETVSALLVHGADSNIISTKDGMAALHICSKRGDNISLDLLLAANTNPTLKTRDGQTALDIAKTKGFEDIYSRLMRQRRSVPTIQLQRRPNTVNHLGLPSGSANNAVPTGNSRSMVPLPPQETAADIPQHIDERETGLLPVDASASESATGHTLTSTSATNSSNRRPDLNPVFNPRLFEQKSSERSASNPVSSSSASEARFKSASAGEYSIIGQGLPVMDEATIALKKILDNERTLRKSLESKLEVFRSQNSELLASLSSLSEQLSDLQEENSQLEVQTDRLMGRKPAVDMLTLDECEQLEKTLKHSLDVLEVRKALLIREKISLQKEQRLCVICQEKEKCVVLLPCRHLCLCEDCSAHDGLSLCPLCRQPIAHKIGVYS